MGAEEAEHEKRDVAVRLVEALLRYMSKPLPWCQRWGEWHEWSGGWTEESRKGWLAYFHGLRGRLGDPEASFKEEARHLIRWMDHDGIVGGAWLEQAAEVQDALWELEKARLRRVRKTRGS